MEDAGTLIRAQPEYNNRRITKTGSDYDDHVYTYDPVGNLTGDTLSQHRGSVTSGSPRNFVYDAFGRLVAVTGIVTDEGPTSIAKYRYNGLGFRIMSQEDDNASGSLDSAERRYLMYDERWRVVAAFRDQDAAPKESYVYHAAGWNGSGDAAYIDSVILRDRDNTSCGSGCDPRLAASDGVLEERRFYCQNWRADVVAITAADGTPVETVRYSAYGEPTVYPMADLNMDGKVDSTDLAAWNYVVSGGTAVDMAYSGDIDFDGYFDFTSNDDGVFFNSYDANLGLSGKGRLSTPSVDNRIGYAGYQWDQAVRGDHVRFRVYLPEIGRWTRRDPLGYADGMSLYSYAGGAPSFSTDPDGLQPKDKRFGLPDDFWDYYHRHTKEIGTPDLKSRREADPYYKDWVRSGRPKGDKKGQNRRRGSAELEGLAPITLLVSAYIFLDNSADALGTGSCRRYFKGLQSCITHPGSCSTAQVERDGAECSLDIAERLGVEGWGVFEEYRYAIRHALIEYIAQRANSSSCISISGDK